MARLYNPLDEFSTYSVHYVMLACRTTEDAKEFTNEANNAATLAAIEQVDLLGEAVPYGNRDTAFLVLDTRRFSQFTISDLKYDVLINGVEKGGSTGNLATTVNMTIIDSVGIPFLNFLQWLLDYKMQTNFDGVIFMLRVIFVGHKPDGKTETVQTITIPMHLFKLELNLDHAKGVYNAEFMPNMNFDVRRHDRWVNIANVTTYYTGKGINKLGPLVHDFERQLNDRSEAFFNSVKQIADTSAGGASPGKFGRQVKYMITIPKEWEEFTFNGASMAAATETMFKKPNAEKDAKAPQPKVGEVLDSNLSVEPGTTITAVLDTMFRQVSQIADLAAGRRENGKEGKEGFVTFYKHFVGLTSTDAFVVVHVDVVEFQVPNVSINSTQNVGTNADQFYQMVDGKRIPKNYAEFDYIYTGKNADILNFDLKLQDLQFLLASNMKLGAGAVAGVSEHGQTDRKVADAKRSELVNARAYDPLIMPRLSKDELENFAKFASLTARQPGADLNKAAQDATRNLSMFYAMSPITAVMTIRGNPDIMAKFNQNSFLPTPKVSGGSSSGSSGSQAGTDRPAELDRVQYRADFMRQIIENNMDSQGQATIEQGAGGALRVVRTLGSANYASTPVFVKINIKGPNVDFRTSDLVRGEDFSKAILNDNYYVVMKVTNKIEGSNFTQDLELYSHNVFGMGKIQTGEKQPATVSDNTTS